MSASVDSSVNDRDNEYDVTALFGKTFQPVALHYGPSIRVVPASRTAKSLTLLADAVFNSALVFSEWIDRGLLNIPEDCSVLELGAGTGLPSIRLLHQASPSLKQCITTDYPSVEIMEPLRENVRANTPHPNSSVVRVEGLDWYSEADIAKVVSYTPNEAPGYNLILAADLIWYTDAHKALADILAKTLRNSKEARILLATGRYVKRRDVTSFLALTATHGLQSRELCLDEPLANTSEWDSHSIDGGTATWQGERDIWWEGEDSSRQELTQQDLTDRKNTVWAFELRWRMQDQDSEIRPS